MGEGCAYLYPDGQSDYRTDGEEYGHTARNRAEIEGISSYDVRSDTLVYP